MADLLCYIFNILFMKRIFYLFVFLWVSVALMAMTSDKSITQYSAKVWNIEGGMPGNSVLAVRQMQDGYLRIGPQDGLVRFDGLISEVYGTINTPTLDDTFKIIAGNADGVWNEKGSFFSFYLKPYFYQAKWFYFLVGLFILLEAFSIYRFRVRQFKAREKELSTLVELRTRDLRERIRELESAHEKLLDSKELIGRAIGKTGGDG